MKYAIALILMLACSMSSLAPVCRAQTPDLSEAAISVTNAGFTPQVMRIEKGTSVTWTNLEGVHTTTSRDGLWDSGVLEVEDTFTYPFEEVGFFQYYDTIHQWPSGCIEVVHSLARIHIYLDRPRYSSGDTMKVGLDLANPGGDVVLGMFIWVERPNGQKRYVVKERFANLPSGLVEVNEAWKTFTMRPLPPGQYTFHAALVKLPEKILISRSTAAWECCREVQSDWAGGPGESGPSPVWQSRFDQSSNVAWRPVAGRISLSGILRNSPVPTSIASDAGRPNSVAAGDLNGDGREDVLTTDPVYDIGNDLGAIYWWELLENGAWTQHTVTDDFYGAYHAGARDVDSDGDLDVIAAAFYGDGPELGRNGKFAWFENLEGDASTWEMHLLGDLFWGADYVDAGDLDGDGDVDIVGASSLTDGIDAQESDLTWFENLDGDGDLWGQHDLDLDFPNASEVHVVDMDGDGDLDLVGAYADETGPSKFAWWENLNGDASEWTKHWIPIEFWGSGYVNVGDIDNDGDIDLMGSGYNATSIGFFENLDGVGTAWQAWYVTTLPHGRGLCLRDLDGDGDLDALVWSDIYVLLLENEDGVGFSWNTRILQNTANLPCAAAGDVDDDGKLDVLVSSEEYSPPIEDQLVRYEIADFSTTTGFLTSAILDGEPDPGWGSMTWDADLPATASLMFEVRASNDPADMGPFVTVPFPGQNLGELIDPNARYLQYRVSLGSIDPASSPVLRDVTISIGQ